MMSNHFLIDAIASGGSKGALKMEKEDQVLEPIKQMLADLESPTSPADSDVKHANGHVITLDGEKGKDKPESTLNESGNEAQANGNGEKDIAFSMPKVLQSAGWSTSAFSLGGPIVRSSQPFSDSDDVTKMLQEQMGNKSPEGACSSHGQEGIAREPQHEIMAPNDVISVMAKILDHLDEKNPGWSLTSDHLSVLEPRSKLNGDTDKILKIGEVVTSSQIKSEGARSLSKNLGCLNSVALEPTTSSDGSVIIMDLNSRSHLTTSSTRSPNSGTSIPNHDVTKTLQYSNDDDTSESHSLDKKQGRRKRGSQRHLEYHLEGLADDVASSEESGASFNDVFTELPEESVSETSFQMTSLFDVATSESSTDSDSGRLLEFKDVPQRSKYGGPGALAYVPKVKANRSNGIKRRKRGEEHFTGSLQKYLKNVKKNFVLNSQKVIMKMYEILNPWDSGKNDVEYSDGPMSPMFALTSSENEDFGGSNEELKKLKKYFKTFEKESPINFMESIEDEDDDVFYESDEGVLSDALGKIWISEENSDRFGFSEVMDESSDVISIKSALKQRAKRAHPDLPLLQAIGIYQESQVARIGRAMEPKFIYEEQRLAMKAFEKDQPYGPPCDGYAGGPISPAFGQMDLALSPIGLDADGGGFGGLEDGPEQD